MSHWGFDDGALDARTGQFRQLGWGPGRHEVENNISNRPVTEKDGVVIRTTKTDQTAILAGVVELAHS